MSSFLKVCSIVEKKVIVDFRSRMLAFRGAGGEPPRLRLWGLTCPATGLGARGHKPSLPKRQSAPFRQTRLMLVAPEQSPSAFRTVQLFPQESIILQRESTF